MAYKMVDPKISEDEIRRRLLLGVPIAMQKEGKRTGRVDFRRGVALPESILLPCVHGALCVHVWCVCMVMERQVSPYFLGRSASKFCPKPPPILSGGWR